jgi:arginyl-tRNA--protein-N-Asp/Glu arginylyltransferase
MSKTMTNKEFNKRKEEKRKMFFDMQEHPDRYTDEQVERLLADEDVKDFFHDMAMVRMAMKKRKSKESECRRSVEEVC